MAQKMMIPRLDRVPPFGGTGCAKFVDDTPRRHSRPSANEQGVG